MTPSEQSDTRPFCPECDLGVNACTCELSPPEKSNSRRTGSWVLRLRKQGGPPLYVCRVNGRDVWLDGPVNAFVWPTKKAALASLSKVRNRSQLVAERSTAHEMHYQAERDQRERGERDDEAARRYRRMWGEAPVGCRS